MNKKIDLKSHLLSFFSLLLPKISIKNPYNYKLIFSRLKWNIIARTKMVLINAFNH